MLDLKGLSESEAQRAIDAYVGELMAADYRSVQQCRGSDADRLAYKEFIDHRWAGGRRNPDQNRLRLYIPSTR